MNLNNGWEDAAVTAEIGIFEWPKSGADVGPSTATAETAVGLLGPGPVGVALGAVQFHASSGLTAGGTVGAVITIYKRTAGTASATAASGVTLAQLNTGGQSLVAWYGNGFSIAAGAYISPGDSITLGIAKTGAGQTIPQGYVAGFVSIN